MEHRSRRNIDIVFSRSSGATEMMMRDCDSLKSASGRRVAVRRVARRCGGLQSISAPNKPFGIETTFRQRHGETAFAAIVRAFDQDLHGSDRARHFGR